jgi:hypothetical protein
MDGEKYRAQISQYHPCFQLGLGTYSQCMGELLAARSPHMCNLKSPNLWKESRMVVTRISFGLGEILAGRI